MSEEEIGVVPPGFVEGWVSLFDEGVERLGCQGEANCGDGVQLVDNGQENLGW